MNPYEVDILDVKSGEVKRVESFVGWTEHSPTIWRERMCDCNLAACRNREIKVVDGKRSIEAAETAAHRWTVKNGACDHSMPARRLRVLKAYLRDGRQYDFQREEFVEAA